MPACRSPADTGRRKGCSFKIQNGTGSPTSISLTVLGPTTTATATATSSPTAASKPNAAHGGLDHLPAGFGIALTALGVGVAVWLA